MSIKYQLALEILSEKNNDYNCFNIKLKPNFRIDKIDQINNYFIKPNDCRWWFGDTKEKRYKNLCKKVPKGRRKEMSELLEIIVKLRLEIQLYIPKHPIDNYSFEKNILKPGQYLLCHKGIVVNKVEVQQDTECPICYNELESKNIFITKCNHKFCGDCIFKHFQKDNGEFCPLCRGVYAEKCIHKKRNRTRRIIYDETEEDNEELIVNTDSRDFQRDNINDNVTINRGNVYNFTNTTIDMDMDFMNDFNYSNVYNDNSYITPPHMPLPDYEVSNINLSQNTIPLQRQQAMNQYGVIEDNNQSSQLWSTDDYRNVGRGDPNLHPLNNIIEEDQISNIMPSFTPQALDTDMLIVSNENSMVYNEVYDEETISIVDSIGDNSM